MQPYERSSVTHELREQADLALPLAQARYNSGWRRSSNLVRRSYKTVMRTFQETDAHYRYAVTQIALAGRAIS